MVYNICVYMKKVNHEVFIFIILVFYLDKEQSDFNRCKKHLKFAFNMKDLGKFKSILGMDIHKI